MQSLIQSQACEKCGASSDDSYHLFLCAQLMNEWMNEILYSACIQPEAVQSFKFNFLMSSLVKHWP